MSDGAEDFDLRRSVQHWNAAANSSVADIPPTGEPQEYNSVFVVTGDSRYLVKNPAPTSAGGPTWLEVNGERMDAPVVDRIADLERENAELRAAVLQYGQRAIGPMTESELSAFAEAVRGVSVPPPQTIPARALRQHRGAYGLSMGPFG